MKDEILVGTLFMAIIFICYLFSNRIMKKQNACINNAPHDWIFQCHSKGDTGDLGFGIKGFWDIKHYRCSKCGKNKEEEL